MTRPPASGARPDDGVAGLVIFLAVLALVTSLFTSWAGAHTAAVSLSVLGAGLKVAAAIRHSGQRPPDRETGV